MDSGDVSCAPALHLSHVWWNLMYVPQCCALPFVFVQLSSIGPCPIVAAASSLPSVSVSTLALLCCVVVGGGGGGVGGGIVKDLIKEILVKNIVDKVEDNSI